MTMPQAASGPLTRQACEPCRQKKTRCTAERPTCSFCSRLGIQCPYLPRGSSPINGVGKRAAAGAAKQGSDDRIRQLELQISDLYNLLGSSSSRRVDYLGNTRLPSSVEFESPDRPSSGPVDVQSQTHLPHESSGFILERPDPPMQVLEHFVEVYRAKLHLQPLPLFKLENLTDRLFTGPRFLLWSFLALTLTFSNHGFYQDVQNVAKDFYDRSSEDAVMRLVWEGDPRLETKEALCLTALKHIKAQQTARAWMAIGAAARLFALGSLFRGDPSSTGSEDSNSRVYWSIFILERFYIPHTPELSASETPRYPDSAPLPTPASSTMANQQALDLQAESDFSTKSSGVEAPLYNLLSIWGKIRCYLHRLWEGEVEKPWLPDSTHAKLGVELIEHEARLSKDHLLRNTRFADRSPTEVSSQREYWNPWMAGEILWHASYAVLNHPFIHLVVLRSQEGIPQSSGFLQQKSDLALYHASWAFRFIQIGEGRMEILNPLLGDIVAATATVLWPFQFAAVPRVAQRAREDLDRCDRFLSSMALTWPHLSQKLTILRKLKNLAERNHQAITTNNETTIHFQPKYFWDLLDPKMYNSPPNDNAYDNELQDPDRASTSGNDTNSQMHLKTHFVQPLWEDHQDSGAQQQQQQDGQSLFQAPDSVESFFMSPENLGQFSIQELSSDFLQAGYWGIPDFAGDSA